MHGCRSLWEQINRTYVGREISETRKPQRFCNPPTVSIVSAIDMVKNRCGVIDAHRGLISIDRTSSPSPSPPFSSVPLPTRLCKWSRSVGLMSRCGPINFKFPYRNWCNALLLGKSGDLSRVEGNLRFERVAKSKWRASLTRLESFSTVILPLLTERRVSTYLRSYRNFLSIRLTYAHVQDIACNACA